MNWIDRLENRKACDDALAWCRSLPEDTTAQQAWDVCPDGDWMRWLAREALGGLEWSRFREATAPARAAHDDAIVSARAAYYAATAPARAAYCAALVWGRAAYADAIRAAWPVVPDLGGPE